MKDGEAPKPGDTVTTHEEDKLAMNIPFYITPATATSSLLIFRAEYAEKSGARAWVLTNFPTWFMHTFTQSVIVDGDMVFLNRQSMQLMHGEITPKDFFTPSATDLGTQEMWRHYNTYSTKGINYFPHTVARDVLPQEQLLDRHEQHVKDCKHCTAALIGIQRGMWVAIAVAAGTAVATGVALAACVKSGSGGLKVTLVGAVVGFVAVKVFQMLKGLEQKFMYESYVHQDKN